MRKVIRIDEPKTEDKKPVEFTHYLSGESGWKRVINSPKDFKRIVYLGTCSIDGDMFAAYGPASISIHKGHLNSGEY